MNKREDEKKQLTELLAWYLEAGADEAIGDTPMNWFAWSSQSKGARELTASSAHALAEGQQPNPPARLGRTLKSDAAADDARSIASACRSLNELRTALDGFERCSLKKTATQLVFADGSPQAEVMFVGEAPGGEEDREGKPFVGPAGKLLDRMLAAIGHDRNNSYITNIVPWRPPGNRNPSANEVALCLPFLRRQIELVSPKVLVLVGAVPTSALLGTNEGITKIRGRWHVYDSHQGEGPSLAISTMPIFHTAYLLRSPAKKKETWRDLLEIQRRLKEIA